MLRAAEILENDKHEFARMMTLEMGKPIKGAIGEAEKCAWVCRYYQRLPSDHLKDLIVETDATRSYVRFQPLGPVLAVMPWNFPFWQVFRFAAPALMAGNVGLLKHASNVPQCALAIEDICRRAGFPEGAFQTLLIGVDAVQGSSKIRGWSRSRSPEVKEPDEALRALPENDQETVLELAAATLSLLCRRPIFRRGQDGRALRTINNGQSCIAAKRFIVADKSTLSLNVNS